MKILLLVSFLLGATTAIIWVTDPAPNSNANNWPGVFPMDVTGSMEKGGCSATLITNKHAITAAHCFDGGKWDEFTVIIDGITRTVDHVYLSKCYNYGENGPNGGDLAVIRFAQPVTTKPYRIYTDGNEPGKEFTLMGWGLSGPVGSTKTNGLAKDDQKFRRCRNVFTGVRAGTLEYSFDDPSSSGAKSDECLAWAGDSGGPAFIEKGGAYYIAGVNSGGDCCKFGNVDQYKRIADFYYWVQVIVKGDGASLPGSKSTSVPQLYMDFKCSNTLNSSSSWKVSSCIMLLFILILGFIN